jgi:hypothetical protein
MDIPIRFAYLPSVLSLIIPWLAIFLSRSDLRRKMIHFTILGSIAGPVSQIWYLRDYWHPAYTLGSKYGFIEDTIFAGLFVGITIVLYNFIFRVKSIPIKKEKEIRKAVRAIILVSILIGSLIVFTNILHINSIYSSAIGFFIVAIWIWKNRPDLIKVSITGSIAMLLITAIGYNLLFLFWPDIISQWWFLQNISGILILGIPVEEFLWFSTWGLAGSPLYEWINNYKFRKI